MKRTLIQATCTLAAVLSLSACAVPIMPTATTPAVPDVATQSQTKHLTSKVWTLTAINGTALTTRAIPTVKFSTTVMGAGRISGTSGCNLFNGTYGLTGMNLTVGAVAATKMACLPQVGDVESAYFNQLGKTQSFSINGAGQLTLTGAGGSLTFM